MKNLIFRLKPAAKYSQYCPNKSQLIDKLKLAWISPSLFPLKKEEFC